jgi:hypothetical protein
MFVRVFKEYLVSFLKAFAILYTHHMHTVHSTAINHPTIASEAGCAVP